jgi:protein dithiol oxidoreductase (disulfide-forming)
MIKLTVMHKVTAAIACGFLLLMVMASLPAPLPEAKVSAITEGDQYHRIAKDPITSTDITMFFWYGCPHCYRVYQAMERDGFYESAKSAGFSVRKVPVAMNQDWLEHAKLFYAFDSQGLSREGHMEAMREIQATSAVSGSALDRVIERVLIFEKNNHPEFNANLSEIKSFMASKKLERLLKRDGLLVNQAKLKGVPTFLVNGVFIATLGSGIGYADLPAIALKLAKGDK